MLLLFFFNDTATTEIYTLSLHDALPISIQAEWAELQRLRTAPRSLPDRIDWSLRLFPCDLLFDSVGKAAGRRPQRSEEHTSELQSRLHLVCRLLLEKKKREQFQAYSRRS